MDGGKKSSKAKNNQPKKETVHISNSTIAGEITSIISIALSILALISVFAPLSVGVLGSFLNSFLCGTIGIGAYMCPIGAIFLSVYSIASRKRISQTYQVVLACIILIMVLSLIHIAGVDVNRTYEGVFDYIKSNYTEGSLTNGGLIGAIFGNFLLTVLGKAGSYIAGSAVILASAVFLTGRSFFGGVKNVYTGVKNRIDERGREDLYDEDYYYEESNESTSKPSSEKRQKRSKSSSSVDFVMDESKRQKKELRILLPQDEFIKPKADVFDKRGIPVFNENAATEEEFSKDIPEIGVDIRGIGEKASIKLQELDDDYQRLIEINFVGDIDDCTEEEAEEISPSPISVRQKDSTDTKRLTKKELADREKEAIIAEISKEAYIQEEAREYMFPPENILFKEKGGNRISSKTQILETSKKLEQTLKSFGVEARVIEVSKGPSVTRYELSPGQGVKVSKISGLADDLALNLAAQGIRIEAPIPGKAAVGIEVPNKEVQIVYFRDIVEDEEFKKFQSKLAFGLGKDIAGKTVVYDIGKMPHLLIAGATGSGKSVCINTLIASLLYKATPDEVKLIMIDPKVVELSVYNGIPHLLIPVVTDPKKASGALNWAVREMLRRYELFAQTGVRDLKGYNTIAEATSSRQKEPQIVIIIDELADLMMAAPHEVEDSICRLAQMARAAGLHLIIATQRPSVDVITGVIKANIPSRLAFSVSSGTDSRTILDMVGAEKLLGRGDMLFSPIGSNKPIRVQGAFISDKEVEALVSFLSDGNQMEYSQEMIDNITSVGKELELQSEDADEYFEQAVEFVIEKEKASASMLQRQFRIGYNRAARLIEDLEAKGIIGPEDGSKPRKVLMTSYMWQDMRSGMSIMPDFITEEQME